MWNLGLLCPDVNPLVTPEDLIVAALAHAVAFWYSLFVEVGNLYVPSPWILPRSPADQPQGAGDGGVGVGRAED